MRAAAAAPAGRRALAWVALACGLGGCAHLGGAPLLQYRCPDGLRFEARLYHDIARVDGARGHAVLERVPDAGERVVHYANATLQMRFGLGMHQRLVRLDYATIPEPIYCERVVDSSAAAPPVRAVRRAPPVREPVPEIEIEQPTRTNIRTGEGPPLPSP